MMEGLLIIQFTRLIRLVRLIHSMMQARLRKELSKPLGVQVSLHLLISKNKRKETTETCTQLQLVKAIDILRGKTNKLTTLRICFCKHDFYCC